MTIRDILEGYGIDFDSLTFEMKPENPEWVDNVWNSPEEEVQVTKKMLEEDEIIVDGRFIEDLDIVPDEPNGYIELYPEMSFEEFVEKAKKQGGLKASSERLEYTIEQIEEIVNK